MPDEAPLAPVRDWLSKAASDLRAGQYLITAQPPLTGQAAFSAQQVAEKVLKAFLTWHGQPFRKTHDLKTLGGQCVQIDPTLENVCRRADRLSAFAWMFRYPGEPDPTPLDVAASLTLAGELYDAIVSRLPSEARPE